MPGMQGMPGMQAEWLEGRAGEALLQGVEAFEPWPVAAMAQGSAGRKGLRMGGRQGGRPGG